MQKIPLWNTGGCSKIVYTLQVQTKLYSKRACLLSILLGYRLKRRNRRKRVVLKNRREIFRDKSHQSLYKNIKLYNNIVWNLGPVYVNESTEYCYLLGLLVAEKNNSCTPCVPMFLVMHECYFPVVYISLVSSFFYITISNYTCVHYI